MNDVPNTTLLAESLSNKRSLIISNYLGHCLKALRCICVRNRNSCHSEYTTDMEIDNDKTSKGNGAFFADDDVAATVVRIGRTKFLFP